MAVRPIPNDAWRIDRIEATVTDGEVYGWLIDGRYEVDMEFAVPIVAWALARPSLLATCAMAGRGAVWFLTRRVEEARADQKHSTVYDDPFQRLLIPISKHPAYVKDPPVLRGEPVQMDVPPLLQALYDERVQVAEEETPPNGHDGPPTPS